MDDFRWNREGTVKMRWFSLSRVFEMVEGRGWLVNLAKPSWQTNRRTTIGIPLSLMSDCVGSILFSPSRLRLIWTHAHARVNSLTPVNSLLLIFCWSATSNICDDAASFKRYERRTNAFTSCFLMTRGVPYKLERYSILAGIRFHVSWNPVPYKLEQQYMIAITHRMV